MKGLLTPLSAAAPRLLQPSSWWLVQETVEGVSRKPLNANIIIFLNFFDSTLQWNLDRKCFLLVLLYSVLLWVCNRPRQNVALAGILQLQNHWLSSKSDRVTRVAKECTDKRMRTFFSIATIGANLKILSREICEKTWMQLWHLRQLWGSFVTISGHFWDGFEERWIVSFPSTSLERWCNTLTALHMVTRRR